MVTPGDTIIDRIEARCVEKCQEWAWFMEDLTPGKAQAFMLQHSIRNRLYSSAWRPAWMSRCPDQGIVRKTISQMLEELVYDDNIQAAHTKILWEMGRNVGLTDKQLTDAAPTPIIDLYCNIQENLCNRRHWIIGWLSTSIDEFVLVALNGKQETNMSYKKWMKDLGLTEEQLFFFTYHEQADLEHAGKKVWRPLQKHVTTEALAADVMAGLDTALNAATLFYKGVSELGDQLDAAGASLVAA